jgi:hypothetical protein
MDGEDSVVNNGVGMSPLSPDESDLPMKVVGRRRWPSGLLASARLLQLNLSLRGHKPFLPRGLHRFRSFEESDQWILKMMTRPPKPGHPF